MRYVRKEISISTVIDKDLVDKNEIREVFNNIFQYNIEFSFEYQKFFESEYDHKNFYYKRARIEKIHNDKDMVDILIIDGKTKARIKNINFEDILSINAVSSKSNLLKTYGKLSRFDFADLTED